MQSRSPDDLFAFKKYRNFVTKFLRDTNKEYLEKLFSDADTKGDLVWRALNKFLNRDRSL